MYYNQGFQSEHNHNCGPMGRGRFGRGKFANFWRRHAGGFGQPPVNIEENDDSFVISLFAAGLVKENVTLTVKDDVLTIAYPGDEKSADTAGQSQYTYREHSLSAFERPFQLNGKVLVEAIVASYTDGILKVTLPKNPETNKPAQTVTVA